MMERVPASGSCIRCQRSLGLASVKRGELWYGGVACAEGRTCPFETRGPVVPEPALYSRPRRFFARRESKELHRRESDLRRAEAERDWAAAEQRAYSAFPKR